MTDYKEEFLKWVGIRGEHRSSKIKVQPTMIKLNGQIYKTEKGKSLWKTPGHAKLALKHDISSYLFYKAIRNGTTRQEAEKIENEIIEFAEFISIDFAPEMLGNLKF